MQQQHEPRPSSGRPSNPFLRSGRSTRFTACAYIGIVFRRSVLTLVTQVLCSLSLRSLARLGKKGAKCILSIFQRRTLLEGRLMIP